jgi:hypothetical protein
VQHYDAPYSLYASVGENGSGKALSLFGALPHEESAFPLFKTSLTSEFFLFSSARVWKKRLAADFVGVLPPLATPYSGTAAPSVLLCTVARTSS